MADLSLDDLNAIFGRTVEDTVFAKYLGMDVRTLRKYIHRWGGVETAPGRFVILENRITEVFSNAQPLPEKRRKTLARSRDGKQNTVKKMVSGRKQGQRKGGRSMGVGRERTVATASGYPDTFGIVAAAEMGKRVSSQCPGEEKGRGHDKRKEDRV